MIGITGVEDVRAGFDNIPAILDLKADDPVSFRWVEEDESVLFQGRFAARVDDNVTILDCRIPQACLRPEMIGIRLWVIISRESDDTRLAWAGPVTLSDCDPVGEVGVTFRLRKYYGDEGTD